MSKFNDKVIVNVSAMEDIEFEVEEIFFAILEDYCKRFKVKPINKEIKVHICMVEYPDNTEAQGTTHYDTSQHKILVQMRNPFLSGWEANPFTIRMMLQIMCHEFVHCCQFITGREGLEIKDITKYAKTDRDSYFFDPAEMEARLLESFYAYQFTPLLYDSDED